MQWLARRLQIFGVHVHVGVRAPEKAIPIVNALLPVRAALPRAVGVLAVLDRRATPGWPRRAPRSSRACPPPGCPTSSRAGTEFEDYMETLISTHAIESVREVWWDIRPHPDFGTVELRICDGLPTLDEIGAVAALAQCLVEQFDSQLDRGYTLPDAGGLGAAGEQVARGPVRPRRRDRRRRQGHRPAGARRRSRDLVEDLDADGPPARLRGRARPTSRGSSSVGASYQRQRAVAAAHGGDLRAVVDSLLAEMRDGLPRRASDAADRAVVEQLRRRPLRRLGASSTTRELVAVRRHLHAHPELGLRRVRDDGVPRAAAARGAA